MKEPTWICREECLVIHEMMLARHGGVSGIRDEALLTSALARPRERFTAGDAVLSNLAACYAWGVITGSPFLSGNACTGFLLALTFLRVNGLVFVGDGENAAEETLALVQGQSSESFYAMYLKCNSRAP